MKAVFGALSLLVVLAIVGWVAVRQIHGVGRLPAAAVPAGIAAGPDAPLPLPERARTLEQRIASDAATALQQGAASRAEADDAR